MLIRPSILRAAAFSAGAFALLPALTAQLSPDLQRSATALGRQPAFTPISATVYLKLHNKAALDAAVAAMYADRSPTYHQFAAPDAIRQYAPTAAEVASVKKELAAHNLKVVSTDRMNLAVRVQGTTADFEAAFHTGINQYQANTGEVLSAATATPTLGGEAAGLVASVSGLSSRAAKPFAVHPVDPQTGKVTGIVPVAAAKASPNGAFFSAQCFYAPATEVFTKGATAAAYQGLVYGAANANTTPGTLSPCGYSPQDVYRFYGLNTVYGRGYTGKGQTVAILDAYGSPTITQDLTTFNSIYNLPPASFKLLTPNPVTGADPGWAGETTLDVEWVHAIAPGADIVLLATPTNSLTDFQDGLLYIIENHTADIISNSWGLGELESDPQAVTSFDQILELAAFTGIAANFSSGDYGDMASVEMGTIDVSSPASSPYATAVGGTSTAYLPDGSLVQTGWGNNLTRVNSKAGGIDNPPQIRGFIFGAGGGTSQYFAKPAYQAALKGTGRLLPDVSALADPFTGVEIIQTIAGVPSYEVIGGTSLAAPVFSAEWALLQQRFGFALGQAAPLVSAFGTSPSVVTDVLPAKSTDNVYGAIRNSFGAITNFSSEALIAPATANSYLSALYTSGAGSTFDLSFGTDSSLAVTPGYDTVTGWGVLNMGGIFNLLGQ